MLTVQALDAVLQPSMCSMPLGVGRTYLKSDSTSTAKYFHLIQAQAAPSRKEGTMEAYMPTVQFHT